MSSLTGHVVGITGHRRWEEQAEMLMRRGARVIHGPVMQTGLLDDADATIAATRAVIDDPPDHVVLTTGLGTRSWLAAAEGAGMEADLRAALARAHVLARGPKARSAALGGGVEVHWEAPGEVSGQIVEHLAALGVTGRRIAVQRDGGDPVLADALRALGADVVDVPVYRWSLPEDTGPAVRLIEAATPGQLDAVTFTCAYAVRNTFELAPDPAALAAAFDTIAAVAVGPVTTAELRRHGVRSPVEPARGRLGSMMHALISELTRRHRVLRFGTTEVQLQGSALLAPKSDASAEGRDAVWLTAGERRLLERLLAASPAVVAKVDLVDEGTDPHAAEAAMTRLRSKLGPLGGAIRTVPRRGYACTLEVEATA